MIFAPSAYRELLAEVSEALGPDRRPALIGIDGRDGEGKTSAATWLAWQLGMPAIHLDLFVERTKDEGPLRWRTDDLANCVKTRRAKPILIEGVLLLDALLAIERTVDFLVFVQKLEPQRSRDRSQDDDLIDPREFSLTNQISRYFERCKPLTRANFNLSWSES
jgi:uridine kinase